MIRILLQLLVLPLRLIYFLYCKLRNLSKPGPLLFHRIPGKFTMFQASGMLSLFVPNDDVHFIEYAQFLGLVAESRHVQTFVYSLGPVSFGMAETEQIGAMLKRISHSGKKLIAHSEGGNLRTLYLMSMADERYAAPAADFQSFFPASEPHYVKGLLQKLGIRVEAFAAGRYKSAGEMFSRSNPSGDARKNLEELIKSLRTSISQVLDRVTIRGNKSFSRMLIDQSLWSSSQLIEIGFLREEITESALLKRLQNKQEEAVVHALSEPASAVSKSEPDRQNKKEIKLTRDEKLVSFTRRSRYPLIRLQRRRSVALVAMEGAISAGHHGDSTKAGFINGHAYREVIEQLADTIEEAVILCINSPGGTPDGSEMIYQAICELKEKKPVIAFMTGVAASGGYYIASAAHRIYSPETTLTGSIGVVRIQPDTAGLYKKLGVDTARIGFDRTQDIMSLTAPLSGDSRRLLRDQLTSTYDTFLDRVARGRKQDKRTVHKFAEGKVWSGRDFLATGMMDGITDVISLFEILKELLGYSKQTRLSIQLYPEVKMDLRSFVSGKIPLSAGISSLFGNLSPESLDLSAFRFASTLLYSLLPLAIRNR
ncbi:MAG: signal peptide peptidase SppA [Leptospirales bacterium]|nr:signal peptide peptidase SppA [Leptospirales bacterium]